jgi:dTDP-4-amino-4,6-dideoxygalactose transaminase
VDELAMSNNDQESRDLVDQLVEHAINLRHPNKVFEPGVSHVPVSGKFFGAPEIKAAVEASLDFWLTSGPYTEDFEKKLAKLLDVKEVVAVSSATTGIELALAATPSLRAGDEVLVPAYTFPACINSVLARGMKPKLVDIDPVTLNLDVLQLKERISRKTKAVIAVDAFGNPCDIEGIKEICEPRSIQIIRDSACALGAVNGEKLVGSDDHPVIFSFHQRKIITTGEGGCVTTNDSEFADRLRRLRSHGILRGPLYASFQEPGFNFRMSEMQASLGISQLDKLDFNIGRHSAIASLYRELLENLPNLDLSSTSHFSGRVIQSFIVKVANSELRDSLIEYLRKFGIESTIGTYDLSCQPAYRKYSKRKKFPVARISGDTTLALPIFARMTDGQIEEVCSAIKNFFGGKQ